LAKQSKRRVLKEFKQGVIEKSNKSKRQVTNMQCSSDDHLFFSDEHFSYLQTGLGFRVSDCEGEVVGQVVVVE
jgi:hypothetical protein